MSFGRTFKWGLALMAVFVAASVVTANIGMKRSYQEVKEIETALLKKDFEKHVLKVSRLSLLPSPVQRYAKFALGERREFPFKAIRWEESGEFYLPELGYFDMKSWQLSRTDSPHYMWRGFMRKIGGVVTLESRDYFAMDYHDMRAKLWGLKTVMRSDYHKEKELRSLHSYLLLRYYGSALNFPWVLFSDPRIRWEADDENHAWMIAKLGDREGRYRVSFKQDGRISKMESPDFHLHGNNEYLRESAEKLDYVPWQGMMVPTHMKYAWVDKAGNTTTYEFRIKNLREITLKDEHVS